MTFGTFEWWTIFLGGASTLAIFSFLIRENSLYRFFEHLFIGIATAIGIAVTIKDFLWPEVFKPLLGYNRVALPDGSFSAPYDTTALWMILPFAFGSLYYCIYSKKYAWLAQLVIGFSLGVSAGFAFKGFFQIMFRQITDSMRPLYVAGSWRASFDNTVFVFTLVSVMSYFFFSFKRKPGGLSENTAASGRLLLMCCLGAFFGSTVMARMALLVERLQFLIDKWWPNFFASGGLW